MATTIVEQEQIMKFKEDYYKFAKSTCLFIGILKPPTFFGPLVIVNCNGAGPWPFRDATILYNKAQHCFPAFMWYKYALECIGKEVNQIDSPEELKREGTLGRLIGALMCMTNKHETCLKQLLEDERLHEEKIKCILALHYFKPLSIDAECFVDNNQGFEKCPLCNEDVKADVKETSFGNTSVWHGQSDIFVHTSIVKIGKEAVDAFSFEEQDEKLDVKTEETKKILKLHSQSIAQTIVNAFVVSGKEKSLFDKFIPSFLATEKYVRILLYNCKLDKLLVSEELAIWTSDDRLCMDTMMFIWVAMNTYVNEFDDTAQHLIDNTPESKFKDAVGDAYDVYLKDVTRPCKKAKEGFTFNEPFQASDENDAEYIQEVGIQMFQAICKDVLPGTSKLNQDTPER